ncbi:HNH endonuclease [Cereibacter sphaeroides]|nr:HNH endonuclease [Cereibacter sphaeroides]
MREVEEWVGRSDDTAPPPRVKDRIIERQEGCCAITGRRFRPGDVIEFDHIIALCNGGENRETNLQAIIGDKHREKTREDVRIKAKAASVRKRHLGIEGKKRIVDGSRASRWKKHLDGSVSRRW